MGKLIKGYWDCPYCGATGVGGDVTACPSCGRARGDVRFYMKDHSEGQVREEGDTAGVEYVDEERAKYINRNPDWYCSYCNSLNSDNAKFCASCGSSRADSESNYFDMLKKKQEREAKEAPALKPHEEKPAPKKKKPWWILLILLAAVIVGVVVYLNGRVTKGGYTVSAVSWERQIAVEEHRHLSGEGWDLPSDAELTGRETRLQGYRSVLDHYETERVRRTRRVLDHYETYYTYEDAGNGYFEEVPHQRPVYKNEEYYENVESPVYRQEPVYATWYTYTYWAWEHARYARASGTAHDARWPDTDLGLREREGARSEVYRIAVTDSEGRTTTYRMAEADWERVSPGDSLSITAKRTGSGAYISDEKGNRLYELLPDR